MIAVEEARARILAALTPMPAETVALSECWQRVAAADISARVTQPPRDVSAMDGFAVRAADAVEGGTLEIAGNSPAGHPWNGLLGPGQAVRLFTGSIMPDGADTVLIQEDANAAGSLVTVRESPGPGRHIRRAGQDFRAGDVLISAGRRLTARDVGLAAAGNHPWIAVHRRPRVAILATGDEIALPGEPIPSGGIVSSNAHALAALVRAAGGLPTILPIAADTLGALADAADGLRGTDLIVTTGGASVGEHDLVAEGLGARGLRLDFWKIAMRPGKPLMHGYFAGVPMIGLPGNPVSALVCGVLFVFPAIERLLGLPGEPPRPMMARLAEPLPANDVRADHLRATLATASDGALEATAYQRQDSAMLRLLASADALILRPPHAPAATAGESVPVLRLDNFGL